MPIYFSNKILIILMTVFNCQKKIKCYHFTKLTLGKCFRVLDYTKILRGCSNFFEKEFGFAHLFNTIL
jgi:hypothetical protein